MKGVVLNPGTTGGLEAGMVVQESGNSPVHVMSQQAVTDFVNQMIRGIATESMPRDRWNGFRDQGGTICSHVYTAARLRMAGRDPQSQGS